MRWSLSARASLYIHFEWNSVAPQLRSTPQSASTDASTCRGAHKLYSARVRIRCSWLASWTKTHSTSTECVTLAEHSRQQRPNWSGICCKQRPEGIVGNLDIHQWLFRFRYKFRHDNRCTFSLRSKSDESNLRIKAFLPFFAAQNLFVSTNFLKAIIEGAAATLSLWFSVFSLQKWTLIFSWPLCL